MGSAIILLFENQFIHSRRTGALSQSYWVIILSRS